MIGIDRDGHTLTLVTLPDGRVGITRNGQNIDGMQWPADRKIECVDAFLGLARRPDAGDGSGGIEE